jgi:ribosomal protein S18 acetylase RimI-like enzyme
VNLAIQPLKSSQIEDAKAVIIKGCFEFFGRAPMDFEDMTDISNYVSPSGTLLVLLDYNRVVGTGAIRRLDVQTCELKRMWFLPDYRGKGYGRKMAELLFEFARSAGYKRVRLDTTEILERANKLYRRLGFQPIERYNEGHGTIFMEKQL